MGDEFSLWSLNERADRIFVCCNKRLCKDSLKGKDTIIIDVKVKNDETLKEKLEKSAIPMSKEDLDDLQRVADGKKPKQKRNKILEFTKKGIKIHAKGKSKTIPFKK